MLTTRILCMKCCDLYTEIPRRQEPYIKPWMPFLRAKVVDDCLIDCKSKDIMTVFKKEILTRFVGTDEGEVTKYLGCELIRDRSVKTGTIVQKGYTERVLKTFGMWDVNGPNSSSPLSEYYWMFVVFGEHDEVISGSGTSSDC